MQRWLERRLEASLDEADTELGYDPDEGETELGDTLPDPPTVPLRYLDTSDDEGETELHRRPWSPAFEETDDEPPTVRASVSDLLPGRVGLRPQPLPVGTSDLPEGITQWPAPLVDTEETWTERRLRETFPDDRTAPSLFPTPEDDGKEQRPYPPPPTPTPPSRIELPAVVTSSLVGMAAAGVLVVLALGFLIVWMRATAP